jgi:hypothetical protein
VPPSDVVFYERASTSLLCRTPAILLPDDRQNQDWEDFRNYLENRLAALRDWRISWWAHWADLAANILPRRYHWLITANTMIRGREINRNIVDTTVVKAFRICCAGLMSGLTSPTRPWFKLGIGSFEQDQVPRDWQLWLDEVERRIYKVMSSSNFYDSLMQMFQDLVCFGTAPMLIYEDAQDIIRCYNPCAGEYYLANGGDLRVNTFYRTFNMSTMQMIDFFGADAMPNEIRTGWNTKGARIDQEYVVAHAIEPNFAATRPQDPNKKLGVVNGGYDYREVYWLFGRSTAEPISIRGFYDKPYIAPRWETTSNDPYGRSVGMDVLPDVKQLYLMQKRLAEAIEKQIRPPMQADVGLKNHPAAITPGAVTYVADVAKGGMRPIYEVNPQIEGMLSQIQALQERVKDGFYNNLFMMISQMEGVQPRNEMEITERKNEQMQELGPVIEKFQNEGAGPAITRIYSILKRNRLLPQMPDSMQGHPITINYVNMLTIAQRSAKTAGMERVLNVAGGFLKAGKPQALDIINEDEFMCEYANDMTLPTKVINGRDEIKQMRAARQKAQQGANAMHGAAQMAPALADASTAAKNFSEVSESGGMDAVARMLGPSGVPNAGVMQ